MEIKIDDKGYADLGFAKLDTDRVRRTGFYETVFCQGKEDAFLKEIFLKYDDRQFLEGRQPLCYNFFRKKCV